MAIWHFEFFIVSKSKSGVDCKDENELTRIISWDGLEINEDSIKNISEKFPYTKGWSEEIHQFGSSNKSHMQLYYEDNILNEISCRIDIRNITLYEINSIISFINSNEAMILYDNKYYTASKRELRELILTSKSFKFCENPRGFMEELSQNNK